MCGINRNKIWWSGKSACPEPKSQVCWMIRISFLFLKVNNHFKSIRTLDFLLLIPISIIVTAEFRNTRVRDTIPSVNGTCGHQGIVNLML